MAIEDDLRSVLSKPTETTSRDFKEAVDWKSPTARMELARDIVCLANRNGGQIIVGVADNAGHPSPVGLNAVDSMPDSTELGKVLGKHFDPPPRFEVYEVAVDGKRYGVIDVDEFARTPHVCTSIGQTSKGETVLRPGAVYRRTDAMQCSEVKSADAMRAVIESAVAKTGAAVRAMTGPTPTEQAAPSLTRPTPTENAAPSLVTVGETLRICDLTLDSPVACRRVLDLTEIVAQATVRSVGGILIPRSIDLGALEPSAIVREPDRILVERTRSLAEWASASTSVIEVGVDLHVRLRETLWEDPPAVELIGLVAYVLSCLLFASRLYAATEIRTVRVAIGLTEPTGRRLALQPTGRIGPLWQTYVATSTVDLIVRRELDLAALADGGRRVQAGRDVLDELLGYFGFRLNDPLFDRILEVCRANIPGVTE